MESAMEITTHRGEKSWLGRFICFTTLILSSGDLSSPSTCLPDRQARRGSRMNRMLWIPAFAGMTALLFSFTPSARASTLILPPNNTGLIGYWPMNEGQGETLYDKSGNGNTGIASGTPAWVDGKFGRALYFDGNNDSVDLGNLNYISTGIAGEYSVSLWIKFDAIGQTFFFGDETDGNQGVMMQTDASGYLQTYLSGYYISNFQVTTGRWYHIVQTQAGSNNIKLYVDGAYIYTYQTTHIETGFNTHLGCFYLASSFSCMRFLTGAIDDVRVYNRALSAQEISRMYQAGSSKRASVNTTGLIGYWPLNEGTGTVVTNIGSMRTNGTIVTGTSSPQWVSGRHGNALSFDGDDSVSIPALNITTNKATFSAWVYSTAVQSSYTGIVYSRDPTQAVGMHFSFGGNYLEYTWNDNNIATYDWVNSLAIPQNEWVLVSVAIEPTKATGYVCRTSTGCVSEVNNIAHIDQVLDTSFDIGRDQQGPTRHFLGKIDDVRIYNRTLSSAEINNLFSDTSSARISKLNTSPVNSVTSGLISYWTFDGPDTTSATSTDRGTNRYNLTRLGGVSAASGRRGQALKFDGVDDRVLCDTNPCSDTNSGLGMGTSDLTASAWIKTASATGTIMSKVLDYEAASPDGWAFSINSSGRLRSLIRKNGTANIVSTNDGTVLTDNVWHHVAAVFSRSGTMKRYIDGVLNGTADDISSLSAQSIYNGYNFIIGTLSPVPVFSDDFESYSTGADLPTNDKWSAIGPTGLETVESAAASKVLLLRGSTGGNPNYATTKNIDMTVYPAGILTYKLRFTGSNGDASVDSMTDGSIYLDEHESALDNISIQYSIDGGSNFTDVRTFAYNNTSFRNQFSPVTISLPQAAITSTLKIRFTQPSQTNTNPSYDQFAIDNVVVAGINEPFSGSIDDVRVYSRALSASEILELYNGGK